MGANAIVHHVALEATRKLQGAAAPGLSAAPPQSAPAPADRHLGFRSQSSWASHGAPPQPPAAGPPRLLRQKTITALQKLPGTSGAGPMSADELAASEQRWDAAVKRPFSLPKMLASMQNKAEAGVAKRLRMAGALNNQGRLLYFYGLGVALASNNSNHDEFRFEATLLSQFQEDFSSCECQPRRTLAPTVTVTHKPVAGTLEPSQARSRHTRAFTSP